MQMNVYEYSIDICPGNKMLGKYVCCGVLLCQFM